MIVGAGTPDRGGRREVDVVVLGSGAGGAAAAFRLSEAGLSVLCLEEGGHYTEKDFSHDTGVAWRQLYAEDGQRLMSGPLFVPVAGGKCLGGSTVINSGISFRIPERRFQRWKEDAALDFDYADLLPHILHTERVKQVAASRREVWGGNNAFCQRGLEALGWRGGPMPRNAPHCVGCGACNNGCPSGSKLSVAKTFIPMAQEHGAVFYTHARADEPILEQGRVVGVRASLLDPVTERPVDALEVRARAVVLAGGAIGSPAFLLHAGLGNDHVGRHLHVHPGTGCMCLTDEDIRGWKGIPQGFYCDEFLEDEGIILESWWATPEVYYQTYPFGLDGTRAMKDFGRMAALGGIIADETEGRVRSTGRPGGARVEYALTEGDKDRLVRVQRRTAELLLAAGGRAVQTAIFGVPPISSLAEIEEHLVPERIRHKQLQAVYSSHPHGSLRMAGREEFGAVDCRGEVYGAPGLFVMDASVFSGVLGVNPQITVMAMSLMLAEGLADRLT